MQIRHPLPNFARSPLRGRFVHPVGIKQPMGQEPGTARNRIQEGLCRFAGGKGMMGEGSQRGCCSHHKAARLIGRREENPQPLPARSQRPASRKAGGDNF